MIYTMDVYIMLDEGDEVIEVNNNDLEKPALRKGDSPLKPMVVDSSDDENTPIVKRKRATRRPRHRANNELDENIAAKSCIYSNTVSECYKRIESGLQKRQVVERFSTDDEGEDLNNNNVAPKRQKSVDTKWLSPKLNSSDRCESLSSVLSPIVVENCPDDVRSRDRSPTPPPPSPTRCDGRNGRVPKRPKAVTQALAAIQMMKMTMPHPSYADVRSPATSLSDISFDGSLQERNEIVVKVRSRFGIDRFNMKSTDTFMNVFKSMAAKEGVDVERCIMFCEDETIEPYMTLSSARITVADIIGFCVKAEIEEEPTEHISCDFPDSIHLQVQAKGLKQKFKCSILKTDPLLKLMLEFARQQHHDVNNIKYYFDGDLVKASDTPQDLDMDDQDCLDAVITC